MIGKFKSNSNGDRKEPQVETPRINFAKLAKEIDQEQEQVDYAPRQSPWDEARATSLDEVGMFRDLSLSELDKLLERLNAEYDRIMSRAKAFRENIEKGHKMLAQEIVTHSDRCKAASDFFANLSVSTVPNLPAPPAKEEPEPKAEPEQ